MPISISIDLCQIDQSRCKKMTRKNGEKASFCELVIIETPDGEYGDYMVKQGVTKEEREARVQMPILGNGKNFGKTSKPAGQPAKSQGTQRSKPQPDPDLDAAEDDIPF